MTLNGKYIGRTADGTYYTITRPPQRDLFEPKPLRLLPGPSVPIDTSEEAAHAIAPHKERLAMQCLRDIVAQGERGSTQQECSARLGLGPQTACPRLRELETANWIRKTDAKRRTTLGRNARVYVATASGVMQAHR